jgi:hypothetical protein
LALLDINQRGTQERVSNPRIILAPDWDGGQALNVDLELTDRAKAEIEQFFMNATLFTDKDTRIAGWRDHAAALNFIRERTAQSVG